MKRIVFAAALSCAALAGAPSAGEPSTNVAWTIETLNLMRAGDPARGARLGDDLACAACHGATGVSDTDNRPNIAGQKQGYLFKLLIDYRDAKLADSEQARLMAFAVEGISDADIADLAAYFAAQQPAPARAGDLPDAAESLDLLGDPKRLIPPCSVCHGTDAGGTFPDMPALAGQSPRYLEDAMLRFRAGARGNDVWSRMRFIAARLTDAEISALAAYFASRGAAPTAN